MSETNETPDRLMLLCLFWYVRRIKALEDLLACYRADRQPSEQLHRELAATRERIDSQGVWREQVDG